MDRRLFLSLSIATPLAAAFGLPAFMPAKPQLWQFAGSKTLARDTKEISFPLTGELRASERFKIIAQNQSVWIDGITLHGAGGAAAMQDVRRSIPPDARMEIAVDGANMAAGANSITLKLTYLPLAGEPATLLLWGQAGS